MRLNYTFGFLAGALLCAAPHKHKALWTYVSNPDSLQIDLTGDPTAEDYGAVPYGKNHVLFSSNRDALPLRRIRKRISPFLALFDALEGPQGYPIQG